LPVEIFLIQANMREDWLAADRHRNSAAVGQSSTMARSAGSFLSYQGSPPIE